MDTQYQLLERVCDAAANQTILCVGDIMLDRFVYGVVSRVSPEAPIPVLEQRTVTSMLGAVGNVARNVASLGARAVVCSVTGADSEAEELLKLLSESDGLVGCTVQDSSRHTTLKVRYVANGQQLLRVDREEQGAISEFVEGRLCDSIAEEAQQAAAILLSDYAKGCVTEGVIDACLRAAADNKIPLIVDPKGTDFARYGAADLIKPNASELGGVVGRNVSEDEDVETALRELLAKIPAKGLLVTRSEKGLSFLSETGDVEHFPAEKREVYDVSGAGDTSLAALGLAVAEKADMATASQFALIASGIAVSKSGTATVSNQEIRDALAIKAKNQARRSRQHLPLEERLAAWRAEGLKIGFTNGCFDILHAGHIRVLEFSAQHCDRLIVGLNSDASVKRLKGESRPLNNQDDRREVLEALGSVDAVMIFEEDTPLELVRMVQPDLIVKGGDYTPESVVGADIVSARGGEVLICPILEGRSTTGTIEKSKSL